MADSHSSEVLLLLGRLEGKMDALTAAHSSFSARADHHEDRIRAIETDLGDRDRYKAEFHKVQIELAEVSTKVDRAWTLSRAIGAFVGFLGVSGLGILAKVFLHLF